MAGAGRRPSRRGALGGASQWIPPLVTHFQPGDPVAVARADGLDLLPPAPRARGGSGASLMA